MLSITEICRNLEEKKEEMIDLLKRWVLISSGSRDRKGLKAMSGELTQTFASLGADLRPLPLPPWEEIDDKGTLHSFATEPALLWRKRPEASQQILLGGHFDTVYSFQETFWKQKSDTACQGPGAADMKGGLVILYFVLSLLESSPLASRTGWGVFLNPDEELGSPASGPLLPEIAKEFDLALWFEPSLPDGSCVRRRKGSLNFSWVARGKKAHAGRDFFEGKSALSPLVAAIQEIESWTDQKTGLTVNVGTIQGGTEKNIVPAFACCGVSIRFSGRSTYQELLDKLSRVEQKYGLQRMGQTARPPKEESEGFRKVQPLFEHWAKEFGLSLSWRDTGGVCDGNLTSAAGVPTLDTLGVVGGHLHSEEEYADLNSLVPRAQWVLAVILEWIQREGAS